MKYEKQRQEITDICHKMWQLGWVAANDGNITMKLEDGNILATPTGVSKSMITPEMLVLLDDEGNILDGEASPSSEILMHLACYNEREDVGAVIHAHPPTATGFAVAGVPLDRYSMIETVITIGSVPIAPYGTPSTEEVPKSIKPFLAEHDVVLLANHGALTVGADLLTAYYRMETLELFAKISLVAHQLGGAKELGKENIDRLISMREAYGVTGNHPGFKHYREERVRSNSNGGGRDRGYGRSDGDRPRRDGDRPRQDGDRPRRDGDRPRQRFDGERGGRPSFDRDGRPPRRDGDRPRFNNDRPAPRRDGDRPRFDNDRPAPRRDGDRPRFDNDRPAPRRDGDRPRFDNH